MFRVSGQKTIFSEIIRQQKIFNHPKRGRPTRVSSHMTNMKTNATRLTTVIPIALAVFGFSPAFAETNQLLRSGTIEQFANTPIHTREGLTLSVGAVGHAVFTDAQRYIDALTAAQQAPGVVQPGWQMSTTFEEWTDRLILRKTVEFVMIDGNRFYQDFLGGDGFSPAPNLPSNNEPPPTQAQVLSWAADFIAQGSHLTLYPEAAAAGNVSPQALLDELGNNRGPITITETVEFSRLITVPDNLQGIQAGQLSRLSAEPVAGAPLPPAQESTDTGLNATSRFGTPATGRNSPVPDSYGTATYEAQMLNGFTLGEEWSKSIEIDQKWFYFKAIAFAEFGFGVRIPWTATVQVAPSIIEETAPNKTPFEASIKIRTVDADTDFYKEVGLPSEDRHNGKELVIRAGAGIGIKLKVLGTWIVNRGKNNPLIGKVVDLGQNFDPPLGTTLSIAAPELLYETSGLAYATPLYAIGGDFRAQIGLVGNSIDLSVRPFNSYHLNGSSYSSDSRTLSVTAEDSPRTLDFAIRDTSPTEVSARGRKFYRYGPIYGDASYHSSLELVPQARVRGIVYLSSIIGALPDLSITSPWISLFKANFDLPALGPHKNTNTEINASANTRRFIESSTARTLTRESSQTGETTWTLAFYGRDFPGGTITEFLPAGTTLVPGSITGGGIYNPATRSITWTPGASTFLTGLAYALTGSAEEPEPLGKWQATGDPQPRGILGRVGDTQSDADLGLQLRELAARPTYQELLDGRPGSVILQKGPDGNVRLQFVLEASENLQDWDPTPESLASPITVDQPLDAPKKFFRFRMANP